MYVIFIIAIAFIGLSYYSKHLNKLNIELRNNHRSQWLKYGLVSRKHLAELSIGDFENWCFNLLEKLGYKNIEIASSWRYENYKTIISTKYKKTIYVWCKLAKEIDEYSDNYESIGRPDVQRFIGTLEHDNVTDGIIITTGDFTSEALKYVNSLPNKFNISIYDGVALTNTHRAIREKEISLLLQQPNNI